MNKEQILEFLKENPQMINELITPEVIGNFLDGEQGKKYLQPKMDAYFSKGLDSWKANNLEKLINDESSGLPAELELRRKQCDYYRNRLFSFKELKNEWSFYNYRRCCGIYI